ncbi:VanZ like family protein [Pseudoalteromonas sp. THAF3]|uniref:VanZ family protein n=1 Tax=Pseudoalteromonas sp. THAF3 TaxID=2587843 RepID=UPI0012A902D6|nr:VanZ family protein [Pseudoalteromonas sp. THAF3]QFU05381.1 VanZ like family protein [Pseudoalteromonas sp. THAF3]
MIKPNFTAVFVVAAIAFAAFLGWVIYLANSGQNSIFFQWVATIPYGDKLGHLVLFATFTLLATLALGARAIPLYGKVKVYWGALLVFAFALIEEISQAFIATRTFDLADLSANLLGIIAASLVLGWVLKRQALRSR